MALQLYLDFISPYAYLGWTQVHALAERHGETVQPVPVLFAAMLNAHGHKGPAEIPPKRLYVFKNVLRIAHGLGVPLEPPLAHPFNPLLALRVASVPMDEDTRRRLIDELFAATWGGGPGVEDPVVVGERIERVGLDPEAVLAAATSAEGKARVRRQTEGAIEVGVFGVPTIVVGGELFWGYDAYPHVEAFLSGEDPLPADLLEAWKDLPSSSVRPGSR